MWRCWRPVPRALCGIHLLGIAWLACNMEATEQAAKSIVSAAFASLVAFQLLQRMSGHGAACSTTAAAIQELGHLCCVTLAQPPWQEVSMKAPGVSSEVVLPSPLLAEAWQVACNSVQRFSSDPLIVQALRQQVFMPKLYELWKD